MQLPRHVANDALTMDAAAGPASVAGLDVAVATRNVARNGGDAGRFTQFFAAAVAAMRADADRTAVVSLASIAAWRAGALGVRVDALARLGALTPERQPAAVAALGIDAGALAEFVARQAEDRYWWPGRSAARGYVCALGGFTGLGGAWLSPPERWMPLPAPGSFAVRAADAWWRIDADVWGSRVERMNSEPPADPAPHASTGATLYLNPSSYLAWVHVRENP